MAWQVALGRLRRLHLMLNANAASCAALSDLLRAVLSAELLEELQIEALGEVQLPVAVKHAYGSYMLQLRTLDYSLWFTQPHTRDPLLEVRTSL